jgi:hypothetical protein
MEVSILSIFLFSCSTLGRTILFQPHTTAGIRIVSVRKVSHEIEKLQVKKCTISSASYYRGRENRHFLHLSVPLGTLIKPSSRILLSFWMVVLYFHSRAGSEWMKIKCLKARVRDFHHPIGMMKISNKIIPRASPWNYFRFFIVPT